MGFIEFSLFNFRYKSNKNLKNRKSQNIKLVLITIMVTLIGIVTTIISILVGLGVI